MSPRSQGRARTGFTLVELLMVITIIGMLVGLGSYAAMQAIERARVTAIAMDLHSLDSAVKAYKAEHQQYPPDFSDLNYSNRQTRFNNHRSIAFPRCGTAYSTLKTYILNNTSKAYGYNYMSSGGSSLTPLNLDTLDQAEALVFWLGGFPTPYNPSTKAPYAARKTFGFHTDVTNPFRLDPGTGTDARYRTTPLFDFDDTRLTDSDNDGWWEYVPPGGMRGGNGLVPPYAYFDQGSYTQVWPSKSNPAYAGYPMQRPSDTNSQMTSLMNAWGVAVPYAQWLYTSGVPTAQWQQATSFQIISAGPDGLYGNPTTGNVPRIPCFPSSFCFSVPGLTQGVFDQEEQDNITNFVQGKLEDSAAASGQQGVVPVGASGSSGGSGS